MISAVLVLAGVKFYQHSKKIMKRVYDIDEERRDTVGIVMKEDRDYLDRIPVPHSTVSMAEIAHTDKS